MENRAWNRALTSLTHPLTVGAIGMLLLNDHVLRVWWPSWWTGKLGDVAWLVFAPLALAALLAWLIPHTRQNHAAEVGITAFALTGLVFALGKTWPPFHALVLRVLGLMVGGPVDLRRDPTDLLALPALLIGWYIWQQARDRRPRPSTRARGTLWLVLAALATLANSPSVPNSTYGPLCLAEEGTELIAFEPTEDNVQIYDPEMESETPLSNFRIYVSQDGGLTWTEGDASTLDPAIYQTCRAAPRNRHRVTDPQNPQVEYWYVYEDESGNLQTGIWKTTDGGETWRLDFPITWTGATELYHKFRHTSGESPPVYCVCDMVAHEASGNIVVVMGTEGTLVHEAASDAWQWVTIGPYHHADMTKSGTLKYILDVERNLAFVVFLMMASFLVQRPDEPDYVYHILAMIVGFVFLAAWLGRLVYYTADNQGMATIVPAVIGDWGAGLALLLAALAGLYSLFRMSLLRLPIALAVGGLSRFGFYTAYRLWAQGKLIVSYEQAMVFASGAIGLGIIAVVIVTMVPLFRPRRPPSKRRLAQPTRSIPSAITLVKPKIGTLNKDDWLRWIGVNALAVALGQAAAVLLVGQWNYWIGGPDLGLMFAHHNPILEGLVVGLTIGLAQWLALRKGGRTVTPWWIVSTAAAVLLGEFLAFRGEAGATQFLRRLGVLRGTVGRPIAMLMRSHWAMVILAGALVGVAQWVWIRERDARLLWWIGACAVAWPLGYWAGQAAHDLPLLAIVFPLTIFVGEIASSSFLAAVYGAVTGAVIGFITGYVLLRLLPEHASSPPLLNNTTHIAPEDGDEVWEEIDQLFPEEESEGVEDEDEVESDPPHF